MPTSAEFMAKYNELAEAANSKISELGKKYTDRLQQKNASVKYTHFIRRKFDQFKNYQKSLFQEYSKNRYIFYF